MPAVAALPPFHASVRPALRAEMKSWHRGCPVPPRSLRLVRVSYVGFDGRAHTGRLVVHADAVRAIRSALRSLYAARFPIRQMRLVDDFDADDDRSMAADNTSAFNCRRAAGSTHWSAHAYGRAVDINPRENPMILGGRADPPNSARSGRGTVGTGRAAGSGVGPTFARRGRRLPSPPCPHRPAS